MPIRGVTDLPISQLVSEKDKNIKEDLLDVEKYVKGLKNFILNCPTPMSVAIQGDWGTGKTSLINCLMNELSRESTEKIYFNTWQYSQFNMEESLYLSFLTCLISKIGKDNPKMLDTEQLISLFITLGKSAFKKITNLEIDNIEKLFEARLDIMQKVEQLKETFSRAVCDLLKKKGCSRLVIFIDDLDRLNPEIAIELLEVIKNFFDIRNVIFVLAIDYDVVVQGVKKKYGTDITMDKCKSFFDKIIQLPFRMPVELYSLQKLIDTHLDGIIVKEYTKQVESFIKVTLGSNPRTFKRLVNSFLLIHNVKFEMEKSNKVMTTTDIKNKEDVLMLIALCIQLSDSALYSYLISTEDWIMINKKGISIFEYDYEDESDIENLRNKLKDILADYTEENILEEKQIDKSFNIIKELKAFIGDIQDDISSKDSSYIFILLSNVMKLSMMTDAGGTAQSSKRAEATKVDKILINEVEVLSDSNSAADAYKVTFEELLKRHKQDIDKCIVSISPLRYNKKDETLDTGFFRSSKIIKIGDKELCLGTSSSFKDKAKSLDILCNILGLPENSVKWFSNDRVVYPMDKR